MENGWQEEFRHLTHCQFAAIRTHDIAETKLSSLTVFLKFQQDLNRLRIRSLRFLSFE